MKPYVIYDPTSGVVVSAHTSSTPILSAEQVFSRPIIRYENQDYVVADLEVLELDYATLSDTVQGQDDFERSLDKGFHDRQRFGGWRVETAGGPKLRRATEEEVGKFSSRRELVHRAERLLEIESDLISISNAVAAGAPASMYAEMEERLKEERHGIQVQLQAKKKKSSKKKSSRREP